jgi:EAL domain-containing protein (putative c-di-GMP-specific phosphodiesterase class I)
MLAVSTPPRAVEARQSFGDVAREMVRGASGGHFRFEGLKLTTHFQPIYCVRRAASHGYEALLRAESDDGQGLRARALFQSLDPAARTRFDWLCRALHLRNFAVVDPGDRRLFLNVLPAAMTDDADDGRAFAELVRFYGLAPDRVVLEIVEADSGDETRLGESAEAHRALGFTIAMDHFGQGHSNFDRIAALRPKLVKLDRTTLRHALGDTQARRMLPSLVDMLGDTGARVGIKGIDSANDALAAIEAGADYLQGFHLGAPSRTPRDETLATGLIESARHLAAA